MKVRELMTRDAQSCRADDSMTRAAELMWTHDCGALPIVDKDGRVNGMITDRDIAMAGFLRGRSLADMRVVEAASRELHSCRPEDSLAEAQRVIRTHGVRRLPVVDGAGKLVGILSMNDLFRARARLGARPELVEVLETAAAVC